MAGDIAFLVGKKSIKPTVRVLSMRVVTVYAVRVAVVAVPTGGFNFGVRQAMRDRRPWVMGYAVHEGKPLHQYNRRNH